MIERTFNHGKPEFRFKLSRPGIYLDHCALRTIAQDNNLLNRFITRLKAGGSLLFSTLHLSEINACSGDSIDEIHTLLREVGCNWYPLEFNIGLVLEREMSPFSISPIFGEAFFNSIEPFLDNNSLSLDIVTAVVSKNHEAIGKGFQKLKDSTRELIDKAKKEYLENETVRKQVRTFGVSNCEKPAHCVFNKLGEKVYKHKGFIFQSNDAADYLHSCISVISADYVVLDKRWAQFAREIGYGSISKIYRVGDIQVFVSDFEADNGQGRTNDSA